MTESPTAVRTPDAGLSLQPSADPGSTPPEADAPAARPTLAVWKFASCDGCQLTLLNCEDELLAVAERVQIAYFPEATTRGGRRALRPVSLVEGSITTPGTRSGSSRCARRRARLVTIGACATAGGIQALRNFADVEQFRSVVYAHPEYMATLDRSTAIAAHVTVDFELHGCPIDKGQLLEVLTAMLQDRRPRVPAYSVCVECKRRGAVCVAVADGMPCLGPVTQAGCGALCPAYHRGCYGCFGPHDTPNTASLAERLRAHGMPEVDVMRFFRTFNAGSEPFRAQSLASAAADPSIVPTNPTVGTSESSARSRRDPPGGGHMTAQAHIRQPRAQRGDAGPRRGRGRHARPCPGRRGHSTCTCGSSSRRGSSRRSCAAGRTPSRPTSPPGSAASARWPTSSARAWRSRTRAGWSSPTRSGTLRRLLYCGEWIESHALHIFLLHAPDLLGYDGAIEMARDHRGLVESALRMKRAGNELMTVVGGRSVHPVNVRVGGFHRLPRREELLAIRPALVAAREEAIAAVPIVSGFEFPDFEQPYLYLSLDSSNGYPLESGNLVTSAGLERAGLRVRRACHRAARRALQRPALVVRRPAVRRGTAGALLVELRRPLAAGRARRPALAGLGPSCRNPFKSIIVRTVELIHALDEAIAIIDGWQGAPVAAVDVPARAGEGHGATRGAARAAVPPLPVRRVGHDPRRADRPADVAEPDPRSRPTCERSSRPTCTCRTRS